MILGQDTRQSSPALAKAVVDAVAMVEKASLTNLGVVTTPQLHYLVVATNTKVEISSYDKIKVFISSFPLSC